VFNARESRDMSDVAHQCVARMAEMRGTTCSMKLQTPISVAHQQKK
jgi:hypothetical protein